MGDLLIRIEGRAGRVTLNRPAALNALTWDMVRDLTQALRIWRDAPEVDLVLIDAAGDRAFCAGGDIAQLYAAGRAGDFAPGQGFWRDEYRLNAQLHHYPKPVVTLLKGFTFGGGVGLGCHASHRIVGESSRIALPEVTIGLVPDAGSSHLLARSPGRLGEYLGTTATRMGPADAIFARFADHFVPEADWPALTAALVAGDPGAVTRLARPAPAGQLADRMAEITRHFGLGTLPDIVASLRAADTAFARATLDSLAASAPLAAAAAIQMQHRLDAGGTLEQALALEYRYVFRAQEQGDVLEGIRAALIDRDRTPRWRHADIAAVTPAEVAAMLAPLDGDELTFED